VARAFTLDGSKIDRNRPLATFHARDVLAPAAAALACGVTAEGLGDPVDVAELAPAPFGTCRKESGSVVGEVIEADRFGSLRFNIPEERLDDLGLRASRLELELGHNTISVPFALTFADVAAGDPVALVDSSGWLTLAVNTGNASDRYGAEPGTHVRVRALG
jgi:S-adenosylmethionine hydrolase